MRTKGIKNLNRYGSGDEFVRVIVEVPKNLTDKQKKLIREFDEATKDGSHYEKRKSFFAKLKDLF